MTANILVLDFGGVISKTLFETHPQTEQALGLPAGTLTWQGPFAPEDDPLWTDMQNDKITEREYWLTRTREVGDLCGKNWTKMEHFLQASRGKNIMDVIRPEFLETIANVKTNGGRLAILSNELDLFYGKDFRDHLPFLSDFETIVDCSYTDYLKPDARAYQDVFNSMGVSPDDCVFVDDQHRNIVGAQNVGMHTVHFDVQNPQASYSEALQKMGLPKNGI